MSCWWTAGFLPPYITLLEVKNNHTKKVSLRKRKAIESLETIGLPLVLEWISCPNHANYPKPNWKKSKNQPRGQQLHHPITSTFLMQITARSLMNHYYHLVSVWWSSVTHMANMEVSFSLNKHLLLLYDHRYSMTIYLILSLWLAVWSVCQSLCLTQTLDRLYHPAMCSFMLVISPTQVRYALLFHCSSLAHLALTLNWVLTSLVLVCIRLPSGVSLLYIICTGSISDVTKFTNWFDAQLYDHRVYIAGIVWDWLGVITVRRLTCWNILLLHVCHWFVRQYCILHYTLPAIDHYTVHLSRILNVKYMKLQSDTTSSYGISSHYIFNHTFVCVLLYCVVL